MTCSACNAENSHGARFCNMCGEALQAPGSRERRRVSVVFIDLTAFTSLTLGFDPEELRDLADEVLTVVAGVIEDYDGYVDAFRGDGLIALFGAPKSHPDDPERAVLSASASLRAIEAIGRARGYPLKGRAGVNTGVVIAGAVGSARSRDYTVMGGAVNLAARLEAAAIPGEVWVGQDTFEATRHRLVYEKSPPIRLAGFPNVRHAYRLVSPVEEYDNDPYGHLDLVGREAELDELSAHFQAVVAEGTAREVWIEGEPGSGKTRLLREFAKRVQGVAGRFVWLPASAHGAPAWNHLARQLLGMQDGEDRRVRQQKVGGAIEELLPGSERRKELILGTLDLAQTDEAAHRNNRKGSAERAALDRAVSAAWKDLMAAAAWAQDGPLVLAVETTPHDSRASRLFRELAEAPAPLLLLRSGREAPRGGVMRKIRLQPLDAEQSLQLLRQVTGPELAESAGTLVAQVGGVPAYLLELGRALSSTGSEAVSGSLTTLLQARLDLLSLDERQLLAVAALTGERCWERQLLELTTANEDALRRLIRENLFVTENSSEIAGNVAYRFQSELLRGTVLRMIPFGDRPLLHLQIASWLEKNAPLELSELTALHFSEGGSGESAFAHFLAAAELAEARNAPRAHELYLKLTELDVPAEMGVRAHLALLRYQQRQGMTEPAVRHLQEAEKLLAEVNGEAQERLRAQVLALREKLGLEARSGAPVEDAGASARGQVAAAGARAAAEEPTTAPD